MLWQRGANECHTWRYQWAKHWVKKTPRATCLITHWLYLGVKPTEIPRVNRSVREARIIRLVLSPTKIHRGKETAQGSFVFYPALGSNHLMEPPEPVESLHQPGGRYILLFPVFVWENWGRVMFLAPSPLLRHRSKGIAITDQTLRSIQSDFQQQPIASEDSARNPSVGRVETTASINS